MTSSAIHKNDALLVELFLPIPDHLDKGIFDLPLLPHVASQVLPLLNDPDVEASKLSALIQQNEEVGGAPHVSKTVSPP